METGMKDPSTLTRTPATGPPPRTGVRPPVVERIAGWSARHRAIALIGWLLLVAGAVVIGNTLGTKNLNSYDPGEAGRAERVLSSPGVVQRADHSRRPAGAGGDQAGDRGAGAHPAGGHQRPVAAGAGWHQPGRGRPRTDRV